MIAIICALQSEAEAILSSLTITGQKTVLIDHALYSFDYDGVEGIMLVSGVGKVNSAIATQYAIDIYKAKLIFNYGTCGANLGKANLGEVYLIDKCAQYDVDISEIDDVAVGVLNGCGNPYLYTTSCELTNIFKVRSLATGDRFSCKDELTEFIAKNFDTQLRDMEGASILQVANANGVACVMLKGVSDYVGSSSISMYNTYASKALVDISTHVSTIFESLNKLL
ncbi:MAG: 5'-methylthioadenosine/S-adenosylhomocysteine nucleosidase [Clostridia bacterium]